MAEEPTERPAIPDPLFPDRSAAHHRGTSDPDESESLRIGPWVPVPRAMRGSGQRLQVQGRAVRTVRLSVTSPAGQGAAGPAPRTTLSDSVPRPRRARRAAGRTAGGLWTWGREHLALVSVASVVVVLLLFSIPFLSGVRRTGSPDERAAAPQPPPAAGAPTSAPVAAPAPPTSEQSLGARPPVKRQSTSPPAVRTPAPPPSQLPAPPPRPVRPAPPVLVGPETPGDLFDLLMRYCDDEYGKSEAQLRNGIDPATDNWVCKAQGDEKPIDMTAACRFEYGRQVSARFTDAHNAFSWGCYRR